jgi:predicted DNA-binding transcriptional regulator AlpA
METITLPERVQSAWMTAAEVCELLGCTRQTLWNKRRDEIFGKRKDVESRYAGNVILKRSAVDAYFKRTYGV